LIVNKGFRLGRTKEANWVGVSVVAMEKTFGRIYGNRWTSFI
jgi:hypothetical protein